MNKSSNYIDCVKKMERKKIYYTRIYLYNEKVTSLNHLVFHLPKKGAGADPKKSTPAPAQILNRLRIRPKNLGSATLLPPQTNMS